MLSNFGPTDRIFLTPETDEFLASTVIDINKPLDWEAIGKSVKQHNERITGSTSGVIHLSPGTYEFLSSSDASKQTIDSINTDANFIIEGPEEIRPIINPPRKTYSKEWYNKRKRRKQLAKRSKRNNR